MSNIIKVVAMGDNHGNHADPDTLKAVLEFCKDFKPNYKIHLGDNWNFACLRKGVNKDEREAAWNDLTEDIEMGVEWLNRFQPTHALKGNHCARVRDHMRATDSRSKLERLEDINKAMNKAYRQAGVKVVREYTVRENLVQIGPLGFSHGFAGDIMRMYSCMNIGPGKALTVGHWHTAMQMMMPRWGGGVYWLCGAACALEMDYNEKHLQSLRHQNGFMAYIIKDGSYVGRQAHKFNGKWLMPFSV